MHSPDADSARRLLLAGLWIYPVKSCGGYDVSSAQVSPRTGLIGDREWVMLTPDGRQAWMGEFHRMALIRVRNDCDGLVLSARSMEDFLVPFDSPRQACTVKMWNDIDKRTETFAADDAGTAVSEWIQTAIGQPFRLARLGREALERQALLPLHVVSMASWRELNRRLALIGQPPVEIERFRANLIVDEVGEQLPPFAEEAFESIRWQRSQLGQPVVTTHESLCVRCVIPNIELTTANVEREPLALIAAMSRERGLREPTFGFNGAARAAGQLERGMLGFATF
ncbi:MULTISPECIES: MOSC domain-containing protein [unclassified Roseateles]|uniref:MOSC domain-containing protein n=1 Tax=unclassified Roseateles TaxID=2626991 RepID=UPI000715F17A|nr:MULTISPECIES: MOSC N-terminal beta barrel domain-containing protein [unclassified Roseateles]KQW45835.1 hypothetical protein ASC81_13210 [Pelomonas sp. Root405]KRA72680.1 hypothetical protein ASD88_13210 [Pelomonas sp. Root662]